MKKFFLFIFLPVFLLILSCSAAENREYNFEGVWQRTDVIRHSNARIEITDCSEYGFSFHLISYWGVNFGELSGKANYAGENTAVYAIESETGGIERLEFELTQNDSVRMKVTYSGNDSLPDFGVNVLADGYYVSGEPVYVSDEYPMLAAGNADMLVDLRQLLGEYVFSDLLYVMREGYPEIISEHRYKGFIDGIGKGADLLIGEDGTIQLMMSDLNSNKTIFYTNNMSCHGYLPDFIDPGSITGEVEYMYGNTQDGYADENVNIHPLDTKLEDNLIFMAGSGRDTLKFIKEAQALWESELTDVRQRLRVTLSAQEKLLFDKAEEARESYFIKIMQLYDFISETAETDRYGEFPWYADAARLKLNLIRQHTTDLVRYYDTAALWYKYISKDIEYGAEAGTEEIYKKITGYFTDENKETAGSLFGLFREYTDCEARFAAVYMKETPGAADTISLYLLSEQKTETDKLHSLIKSIVSDTGSNPWKP